MEFKEIIYDKRDGIATITINRPEKYNACTPVTIYELSQALTDAWVDTDVGVVVLTGAGEKAFCTGGDQTIRNKGGYVGTIAALPLEVGWQQVSLLIRTIPKPVIARVNGYAIGGGNVFQVVCDLSIASETAQFGQAGPRVGSFDPGYGTGDLARAVGMKRPKRSGSCAGVTPRGRPWRWASSTRSSPRTNSTKRSGNGAGSCWRRAPPP